MSKEKAKREQSETGIKAFWAKIKRPKILIPILAVLFVIIVAIIIIANLPHGEENGDEDAPKTSYKTTYAITFNSNGGSAVATQFIEAGITVRRPHNPTKEGYYFGGWYEDEALTKAFDFDTIVKENTTLYAKWKTTEDGDDSDEKNEEKKSENNSSNREISQNSNPEPASNSSDSTPAQSNDDPAPTPKTYYTVSFNSNGGSPVGAVSVESGKTVSAPATPTKAHYNFAGWTLNGANYNFGNAINGNTTLTASWNQKAFRIVATPVDAYSPDVNITVTEDGISVPFSAIYSGGAVISDASNPTASRNELVSGTYTVVLSDGTTVSAGY